jgi:subtilisin family serine protease
MVYIETGDLRNADGIMRKSPNSRKFREIEMMPKKIIVFVLAYLLIFISTAGCVISDNSSGKNTNGTKSINENANSSILEQSATSQSHITIAIIDSGVNPYHIQFRRNESINYPSDYIENYPKDSLPINLNFQNTTQQNGQDSQVWSKVEREKLYWIPKTCIMGAISFGEDYAFNFIPLTGTPIWDDNSHGTFTSSAVLNANPDASLIIVECGTQDLSEALEWTVNQPFIDIISLSWAFLTGANYPDPIFWKEVHDLTKKAVDDGKIVVAAAGNRDVPPWGNDCSGPPWVISVGGIDSNTRGEIILAAKGVDFVANYTQYLAIRDSVYGYEWMSGTSLSAPYVAGIASKILLQLRESINYCSGIKDGALIKTENVSIINSQIRDAMNKTAIYVNTTDYNPLNFKNTSDPYFALDVSIPINPVAPWLQMGWGYPAPETVDEAVSIIFGKKQYEPSLEKQLAEPYMSAIYELRCQFWDNWPLGNT